MRGTFSRHWMRAMIDLSPVHLAIVERILAKHVPEYEVRGFGSRATWNAKDYSDLDLAVVGDEPLPSRTLSSLKEAFEESRLPMRVDVIDWNAIAEGFRELIASDTVVVQEAPERVEWPAVALSEVVELTLSSVDKKSKPGEHPVLLCNYTDVYNHDFIRAEMDFMSATATDREIGRCSLVEGDVIITKDSEAYDDIGVPALVREHIPNLLCGYHLAILRAKPEIDSTYLFYALKTREVQQQFHAYANGVTRYGLRKADIGLVELPLPPLEEQRAIAHVLSTLDDKIELNRRMNETLEEMARALFKSWFMDFDPVYSKAECRHSGLPPDLDALFPVSFKVSELGEIPDGWIVGSLGDIAVSQRRGVDPATVVSDMPYIGLKHMPRHSIALMDWDEAESVSSTKSAFEVGDILFGKLRPYFHKVGVAPVDGLCSTDIVVLKARVPRWSAFVLACVSSPEFIAHTSQTSTGTKMPRTSWEAMSTYELCRPTDVVAIAFQDVVSPMLRRIIENIHESRTLAALRDALLPQLISGAIRISHVERAWASET